MMWFILVFHGSSRLSSHSFAFHDEQFKNFDQMRLTLFDLMTWMTFIHVNPFPITGLFSNRWFILLKIAVMMHYTGLLRRKNSKVSVWEATNRPVVILPYTLNFHPSGEHSDQLHSAQETKEVDKATKLLSYTRKLFKDTLSLEFKN